MISFKKTAAGLGLAALLAAPAWGQEPPKVEYAIHGYGQADYKNYGKDHSGIDGFSTPRMRLDLKGTIEQIWAFRLYGEFGGSGASLQEGWLEYKRNPAMKFKMGQYKAPFSQEALLSAHLSDLTEAPLIVKALAPVENPGAMLHGVLLDDSLNYAIGAFNSQGKNKDDVNDTQDTVFRLTYGSKSLWLGVNGASGYYKTASAASKAMTSFKSPLGTEYLTIGSTAIASTSQAGNFSRSGVEFVYMEGPFSLKAEGMSAKYANVTAGANNGDVSISGNFVTLNYLLTGETKVYGTEVEPASPFGENGWGAWEVSLRSEAFTAADGDKGLIAGSKKTTGTHAGVSLWAAKNVRIMLNGYNYKYDSKVVFDNADPTKRDASKDADTETGLVFRFQFSY